MAPFDRFLKTMLRPWVAGCYLGIVVLSFFYFDKLSAYYLHDLNLQVKLPFIYWLTCIGAGEIYISALFLLALFCRYILRNKEWEARTWFLWLCILFPYLICGVLKVTLGRARPDLLFDSQLFGFYGMHFTSTYWSFPSGHTTTIMALVLGLSIIFPRHCCAFLMTGILVVSTRVLLAQHYLSDVMATSYLTLLEVGLLLMVLRRKDWLTLAFSNTSIKHSCHECT